MGRAPVQPCRGSTRGAVRLAPPTAAAGGAAPRPQRLTRAWSCSTALQGRRRAAGSPTAGPRRPSAPAAGSGMHSLSRPLSPNLPQGRARLSLRLVHTNHQKIPAPRGIARLQRTLQKSSRRSLQRCGWMRLPSSLESTTSMRIAAVQCGRAAGAQRACWCIGEAACCGRWAGPRRWRARPLAANDGRWAVRGGGKAGTCAQQQRRLRFESWARRLGD